jgi:glycosyltransferase involved in cell wall biosynthesis
MRHVINGKFAAQRVTGVQRVAYELLRAMESIEGEASALEVAVPENAKDLDFICSAKRLVPWFRGELWEQVSLPLATRGEMLVSLCNSGPIFKRRQVVMVHDTAVYDTPHTFSRAFRTWYRIKFAMLLRRAPLVLTVSSFSKRRICTLLGIDTSRVRVVRPGADHLERVVPEPSVIDRLKLRGLPYCVIVGSLDPRKNLARVLLAIERLGHLKEVKFVIVGGANARIFSGEKEPQLGESRQNERVVRAGYVTDAELKALYENAVCLVFPSLYEGFGLPPLEAMSCGCPAIVSTHPALAEACGDAALACDASSVDDIAGKIATMVDDTRLRETYRLRGLSRAMAWRWQDAARELMNALKSKA